MDRALALLYGASSNSQKRHRETSWELLIAATVVNGVVTFLTLCDVAVWISTQARSEAGVMAYHLPDALIPIFMGIEG